MIDFNNLTPVQEALTTAQNILVVSPSAPTLDKMAASLALFLSLRKAGKKVSIVCPEEMRVEFSSLVGINKVKKRLDGRNLVVSFDYDYIEDAVEKVSYNIEGGRFNLVIQPKEGFPPPSTKKIQYSYKGAQADLVFIVGSSSLDELGEIYKENKELFEKSKTVNFDNNSNNHQFGKINFVDPHASSCSELIAEFLSRLKLPVDIDIASNLLYGLEKATKSFSSPKTTAGAFEAAAFCLRAGAKRQLKPPESTPRKKASSARTPQDKEPEKKLGEPEEKPSPDWLGPKIYKGNMRV